MAACAEHMRLAPFFVHRAADCLAVDRDARVLRPAVLQAEARGSSCRPACPPPVATAPASSSRAPTRPRCAVPTPSPARLPVPMAAPAAVPAHLAPDRRPVAARLPCDRWFRKPAFPQRANLAPFFPGQVAAALWHGGLLASQPGLSPPSGPHATSCAEKQAPTTSYALQSGTGAVMKRKGRRLTPEILALP